LESSNASPAKASAAAQSRFANTVKSAQANHPQAQYELSRMYQYGDGVTQDSTAARAWLERAAAQGHVQAQLELGTALRDGDGTIQHFGQAVKWLEAAAENGNADAQYHLAVMYQLGSGIAADHVKAYMWFNLAAAGGVKDAVRPRDAVMQLLSAEQIAAAQTEARERSDAIAKRLSNRDPASMDHKPRVN
jgi:hypothetical protein